MKTLKWNGEYWYTDERSRWKRVRQWLIWIGGWEKANGKGWQFRTPTMHYLMSPAPVSLFGHRFTWYGWGWEVKIRKGRCYLVWSRSSGCYVSSDATPPDSGRNTGFFLLRKRARRRHD